jgi:prolyl-tRNA editing enzyme YbaK/EbsC (Cys-tRNA(Pro) deacylase)
MSIGSVVQDFLKKGLECTILNSFEAGEPNDSVTQAFKVKEQKILIVTDREKEISFEKFLRYFKASPDMLKRNEISEVTGHPSDCLSPFGLKNPLKVYIDVSLKGNNCIQVSAGMKNFVVKLTPLEMAKVTGGQWIDICNN